MASEIEVKNNPDAPMYDAIIDGHAVASIIYELKDHRAVISHTIVEPEQRGKGIGTVLVKGALDDIRARGLTITNYCGFVSRYIKDHPEYADLIDTAHPGFVYRP